MDLIVYPKDSLKVAFPKLSKTELSGIYFIYGEDQQLLYIGKAKNLYSRLYAHFFSDYNNTYFFKKYFTSFTYEVMDYCDVHLKEKEYIKKFKPIYNSEFNEDQDERNKLLVEEEDRHRQKEARENGFDSWEEYEKIKYRQFMEWEGL